ncbi:MAG: biopolymer transporter ExbD [Burkholderiaceae bacterium]|jgi:biopolymer transport protein ExbD
MNFAKRQAEAPPEINLIAFIDVLLVVLIFLVLTTTYERVAGLRLTLPSAQSQAVQATPQRLVVAIDVMGQVAVNGVRVPERGIAALAAYLEQAKAQSTNGQPWVVISADAQAAHQDVIDAMVAARRAGLTRVAFAARVTP